MKNYKFKINGNNYSVDINEVEGQEIKLEVNGTPYTVTVDKEMRAQRPRTTTIINNNNAAPRVSAAAGDVQRSSAPRPGSAAGGTKVTSPLPGTILDVFVNVGDQVKVGQTVVLLEAMKMENNINCGRDGVVKAVYVQKGDNVLEGADLLLVE